MKNLLTLLFIVCGIWMMTAQDEQWPALDASTLDMLYFPEEVAWRNYLEEDKRSLAPKIKITYSRPKMNDRAIFGALLPYGEEWRLGANEATTIRFYGPVTVGNKTLQAGAYTLSVLVEKDFWTINFSTESGIWGNANRDKNKTMAKIKVPVMNQENIREVLAMAFQEVDERLVNLVIEWAGKRVVVPIGLNPVVYNDVDSSPLDIAHYPRGSAFNNYADGEAANVTPKIQVMYSRPLKRNRNVFGDLIKFGEVWRLGANEATEIELFEDVSVNGIDISRGRYALFARVGAYSWDIIFSKDFPIWGAFGRDETKDFASITVPVFKEDDALEALSIMFKEKSENEVDMLIGWDQTRVAVPFTFR